MAAALGSLDAMRVSLRRVSILWVALVALLVVPGVAHADDDTPRSWRISRYEAAAVVAADGTATVTLDFDFDFARDAGHGPFINFPQRQRVTDNPDLWRMIDVTLGQVSSGTGASVATLVSHSDGNIIIRVGEEGRTWTGVQNYRITYRVRGLVDPNNLTSGLDEVNWQAIGPGWQVPIEKAKITITGPVEPTRVACWWGPSNDSECASESDGKLASFAVADVLRPGDQFQAVAGYPAGTFAGAEPRYTKRHHFGNMFPLTPTSGVLTGMVSVLGLGLVAHRTRRAARDEVYLGLTPGLTPAPGEQAVVGRGAGPAAPVAVQFTPPKDARPGEIGVLQDATADNVDITATIIDLAVRGHLTITEGEKKQWVFTRTPREGDALTRPEKFALNTMFGKQTTVTTKDLRKERYGDLQPGIRSRLYDRVTKQLKWFKKDPNLSRAAAVAAGGGLLMLGVAVGFALGFIAGLGLVGLAFILTGVAVLVLNNKFGGLTADGSAVLAQSKGFELYLRTAEADQIKFEEGVDVFSRYLPFAIVFGVAERWAKVFAQLAAEGRYVADTSWYVGPNPVTSGAAFGSSMNSLNFALSNAMTSSIAASNAQSVGGSGSSGFSGGGGGFGGGGGGGW